MLKKQLIILFFLVGCVGGKEKITGYRPSERTPSLPPAAVDGLAERCDFQFTREMNLSEIASMAAEMRFSCGLSEVEIVTLAQQELH